jgi:hypothetical protein
MINQLPEGKSIGWMQAPPEWIFTHTVRFVGIVRVVIQDGEGFILIRKGKPLVYYFKHGRIELVGSGALDYFNSHPIIEFNLCKYTPEEFSLALKVCNIEEARPEPDGGQEQVPVRPAAEIPASPVKDPGVDLPGKPGAGLRKKPEPIRETTRQIRETTEPIRRTPAAPVPEKYVILQPGVLKEPIGQTTEPIRRTPAAPVPEKYVILQPGVLKEADIRIIGQIKKLNGIVAISVFNDDRNLLLMGEVEIEPLLKIARTMLATTHTITPLLDWGSFVHMTLQIPDSNVIIAPYHGNHLCILTTKTINIGHIRRILRDLQEERHPGGSG